MTNVNSPIETIALFLAVCFCEGSSAGLFLGKFLKFCASVSLNDSLRKWLEYFHIINSEVWINLNYVMSPCVG